LTCVALLGVDPTRCSAATAWASAGSTEIDVVLAPEPCIRKRSHMTADNAPKDDEFLFGWSMRISEDFIRDLISRICAPLRLAELPRQG
jgi:hypothetical protein